MKKQNRRKTTKNNKNQRKNEINFSLRIFLFLILAGVFIYVTSPPSQAIPVPTSPDTAESPSMSPQEEICPSFQPATPEVVYIPISPEESVIVEEPVQQSDNIFAVPEYIGSPYTIINDNTPYFTEAERNSTNAEFETYSELDGFGRCGTAFAVIDINTTPTEERGSIGMIKPSGWHTYRFDDVIGDKYLYNRCHLIGFQLAGENANELNLITGTRYLNITGMLPFENAVADYIENSNGRVLYRVTPIFVGNELVARGVLMEAYSLTDDGNSICFNVFCFNVQPGIQIDYVTGEAWEN